MTRSTKVQESKSTVSGYRFLTDCYHVPLGDRHYVENTIYDLADWLPEHISSALAAGIIEKLDDA